MISPNSEISGSNQLSINSFGGKSLSNLSIDDSASPKKCFEMHSSLVLYMKYPNNNWISEKSIEDNDKCTNLIGKDSTRGLLTLRTKRGDDIDIEKEVQKMKNIKCKWLKF